MKLKLTRPIVFFDLETTGTDTENDRIVEMAMCKVFPDGQREATNQLFNPERPIPVSATEIHGISDEDVKDKPLFKEKAQSIIDYLKGADIGGYNSNTFDIPLLYAEFTRAGMMWDYKDVRMIDVCNIFKIREARTLGAAVRFYCGREHEDAHSAEADILATVDVLMGQFDKYEDLPANVDELALYSNYGKPVLDLSGKFTTDDKGVIIFNFGQHKGKPAENHKDFLQWMCFKAKFPKDTVTIAMNILNK